MATQTPIGSDLYLWHGDERSDYLLITAHGLHIPTSTFRVPADTVLHFYAPRRQFLRMTIADFTLGSTVEEVVGAGAVSRNYLLSKYQGRHGGGLSEDYDSLRAQIDSTRSKIADGVGDLPGRPADMSDINWKKSLESYEDAKKSHENLIPFDFLTVRNPYKMGVVRGNTLNNALRALSDAGIHYPFVFCSFCRGLIPRVDRTHDVSHH